MSARSEKYLTTERGEIKILFTNRALAEAEERMGKSVIQLATDFESGGTGITEIAILLRAGMEAARRENRSGSRPVTLNDAYDVLDEVGFTKVTTEVMTALAEVLSYGQDEKK